MDNSYMNDWQSVPVLFWNLLKEKRMLACNSSECTVVQPPKELTTEALSMIIVLTVFFVFAVLGSLHTVYEFIYEKNKEIRNTQNNNFRSILSNEVQGNVRSIDDKKEDCIDYIKANYGRNFFSHKDWLSKSRSFLRCFCLIRNGKNLYQINPDKENFNYFHGMRAICSFIVVWGHISFYEKSARSGEELKQFDWMFKFLFNLIYAVDVFFLLSGFLNSYNFSRAYDENNGNINWCLFYLRRIFRITPIYMIVLGFYTTLLSYTGSGPIWPKFATNPVCKENWWHYLLFINNFESMAKSCMTWCWYTAMEMQFYVLSPIFLVSIVRWPRFGYGLASITIFLSVLSSFLISKKQNIIHYSFLNFHLYIDDLQNFYNEIWRYLETLYFKPYVRICPYLIGVLFGYYSHKNNLKHFKNKWITLCFGWIVAIIFLCISLFAPHKIESVFEIAVYNGIKHLFFSLGISWIMFVCLTGQGSFINAFLSWKLFVPPSRLSYCVYLIHFVIIQRDFQSIQEMGELSLLYMVLYFFKVYFRAFVISIPASLLFEMPVMNLFDLYTRKREIEKRDERKEKIKKK